MTTTSAYSPSKAIWHLDRLQSMREGNSPVPVHVQFVLSDLCNHDCSFCAYRISDGLSTELFKTAETHNPNRRIETSRAATLLREMADVGVRAVQFTGGGEPTVHQSFEELVGLAQSLGMQTGLVTNGIRVNPESKVIRSLSWIRISVDAGTEETYCRVRRVASSHWKKLWQNLEALSALILEGVRVSAGFVVTNDNAAELPEFISRCANAGIAQARVGAMFTERGAAYYENEELCREAIDRATQIARQRGVDLVNMFPRRMQDLRDGHPSDPFCGYQYLTTYIGADLCVYRCCNTAYTTRGKIGDLRSLSFKYFLERRQINDGFDARGCHFCQFNGQNAAIASAIREPDDADFV